MGMSQEREMILRQNLEHSSEINVSLCIPCKTYLHLRSVKPSILVLKVSINLTYLSIPNMLQILMNFGFRIPKFWDGYNNFLLKDILWNV